ncbi:MAG: M48 family metalloprotease [Treponema sp.]|jgi:predicted Zn-dependent protease|nr:M48 family metalloprotease [Treponema sp.]
MKTKTSIRRTVLSAAAVLFIVLLSACQSMAAGTGVLAQAAGDLGVIDQGTATTIVSAADAWSKAQEEITPSQEYYIGRAVGANILTNYKIYKEAPALTAYLNKICSAIVINSPKPELYAGYHVAILDSSEINAFSTSGGHIFVTRGLIEVANSEDTLAAVLAHEIAHVQLQHSLKSIKSSRFANAVVETANVASTAATGTQLKELTETFGLSVDEAVNALNNGYSQNQEYDADTLALSLMASAGYEPASLLTMLTSLREKQGNQTRSGFGKTHPSPDRRIASVNKSLPNYKVEDTKSFRAGRYKTVM